MSVHNVDAFVSLGEAKTRTCLDLIELLQMDISHLFAYGGTIATGNLDGKDIDFCSVY